MGQDLETCSPRRARCWGSDHHRSETFLKVRDRDLWYQHRDAYRFT